MSERLITRTDAPREPRAGNIRLTLVLTAGVAVIGLAGFAGWFAHGDTLFWSLLQAGFAWCM